MGGLIVRAYLAGLQPSGGVLPPANHRVRKFVSIGTPHFGSFQAPNAGVQAPEMLPGSALLRALASWNQYVDDLRGVDAIAIAGNAGAYYSSGNADDGVVSLSSASLGFAMIDLRTRIVPYCHTDPGFNVFGIGMTCFTSPGIANITSPLHQTWQIIHSFLSSTPDWATVGHSPSADPYLSRLAGAYFTLQDGNGNIFQDVSSMSFGATPLFSGPNSLFYNEFVGASVPTTLSISRGSAGILSCGPFTVPAGSSEILRCKFPPVVGSVTPLASGPGIVVPSGSTITIHGTGFGSQQCAQCRVTILPSTQMSISSWTDSTITASLSAVYNGLLQLSVQTASGSDSINIMVAPAAAPPASLTIQTTPSGLQFSLDGGPLQTSPQTVSLVTGSTHTIAIAATQPGGPGTQYSFVSWNDNGPASHTFSVTGTGTLAATFKTQYQLTVSISPPGSGTVSPTSGGYYDSGAAVPLQAVAASGFVFGSWTGKVANSSLASTTVNMTSPQSVAAAFLGRTLTVQTTPAGLQFSVDGGPMLLAPQTLTLSSGGTHTIATPPIQSGPTGTQYVFTGWNDGGSATHTFTASTSATLAASFKTQYQLTLAASPLSGGSVQPVSGSFYDAGSAVSITATPTAGYSFQGWIGNVIDPKAQSTGVTLSAPQSATALFTTVAPLVSAGGVVPLFSSVPVVQPGSWISIYGSRLADATVTWSGDFPTSLGGVSVTVNGRPGYLWLVSPTQINLQAPDDTATGPVKVVVTTPNGSAESTVTLGAVAPALSLLDANHPAGIIISPDGSGAYGGGTYDLLGPTGSYSFSTRPVRPGETLVLYGVGFGTTTPPVPAGSSFSGAATLANPVSVTIGGVPATVAFAGLVSAGLYQLNVVVPYVASGEQSILASVRGSSTQPGIVVSVK